MALYDPLTGLPTRELFCDRLRQSIARADRRKGALAVLLAAPAAEIGERALAEAGKRLAGAVRRTDTVARIAPSTFAVIQTDLDSFDAATFLAQKLLDQIGTQAHVGIALYPDDAGTPKQLTGRAEAALATARKTGSPFAFHAKELTAEAEDSIRLARDLRNALSAGELRLHYQPKLDLASGRIVGAEALMRWRHPRHGMLMPDTFIQIAEECELLVPLGRWALEQACRDAGGWTPNAGPPVRVAVNVAPVQFEEPDFAETLEAALAGSTLPADRLEIEITESSLMRDPEAVAGVLVRLGQLGVGITVDDFGTGYSALIYLRRFPVDALKIDRAFIAPLPDSPNDAAIVRAIIGLSRSLNLRVIAEGVANEAQREFLRAEGCDEIQGFHIGEAVPADEFAAMIAGG
jgi:EAL domain-containing protein (putative c-di-GMP-specific phosphodiesterase class I)/GGDEF domain-containing protein